eukprot:CAMPEP_0206182066 /NCGR_PEP_ID=MMETSP1474-20131121/69241_1 /ASSEMBLY_ACC=CAM_ASM_001110 /TAXON_ID=97495 /ORGANISM="Imantonia sp., Strain RCC918" /LENGTH=301 /DNA_ID=CAMNT_0053596567 /DNA_START=24 /DNA_END=929 /DNA_ORIENTATION=-
MEDKRAERKAERDALDRQRAVRWQKAKLAREHADRALTEIAIDALYYFDMFGSKACWKTPSAVTRELSKLKSEAARLEAVKEQIKMRSKGLGWAEFNHAWSKGGKAYSSAELATHLIEKIKASGKRTVPTKPHMSRAAAVLDAAGAAQAAAVEAEARRVRRYRERAGVGDRYAECQGAMPGVETLLGARIEVCCDYMLLDDAGKPTGESEPRWSAGLVVLVSDGRNMKIHEDDERANAPRYKRLEAVKIQWDADVARKEDVSTSAQRLLPSLWNPKGEAKVGGWRMHLTDMSSAASSAPRE